MAKLTEKDEPLPGVKEDHFALNFEAGFQKIGFFVLLAILSGALAGIFSNGYFSSAQKLNHTRALSVNYDRFGRLQTEFPLHFTVKNNVADKYVFSLGGDFTDHFQPGVISPQPDSMYSRGNTLYLVYNDVKTEGDFSVWMYVTPMVPGKTTITAGVNGEPALSFWQFIYP